MKNKYNSIAIYGMGVLGNRLYDELENSEVSIVRVIDYNANTIFHKGLVSSLEEGLPNLDVDLLIITVPVNQSTIKEYLNRNVEMKYLKDIIFEL